MGYLYGHTVKKLESTDGKRQTNIVARNDGMFEFREYYAVLEDGSDMWLPKPVSGIYETAEAAEADARASLYL